MKFTLPVFSHGGLPQRARRQSLCLERERGVGLNRGFFMNDQGLYQSDLLKSACKAGNDGRKQEYRSSRPENAYASSEGVIHWIDVIEFWFLLFSSLP
jgi:hypothetical protein